MRKINEMVKREMKNMREERRFERATKAVKRPKNLLEAMESVVEVIEDSKMDEEIIATLRPCTSYITKLLGITPVQAIFLSIFIDKSEDTRIRPSELASFIGVRTVRMHRYIDEINALIEKGYIKCSSRHDDQTYRVLPQALKAIRNNKAVELIVETIEDTQEFFDWFKKMAREKSNNEIDYDSFMEQTFEKLEMIKDSVFVRGLKRHNLGQWDTMLFIYLAHLYVENNDNDVRFGDIENLYDDEEIPGHIKRRLRGHDGDLFEEGLIENANEDGMAKSNSFKLTEGAKQTLLSELAIENIGKSEVGLLRHEQLAKKSLIYNAKEEGLIKELSSILSEKRFAQVQTRLNESGMRSGFCCIFYGAPGTGKTETVYQLAKQTGRNIMQVDVDKIKSCWVGESEKNIKILFERYRNICKNSEKAPILLFNEADAVLGVRMEGAARAVDKMENSIQNIILQEMEKLEGIMIATTNLTSNLDKAFERRFLYKVQFEKPTVESRAKIWKVMMPGLKKSQALRIAGKFDLSGGEIENVVRRHTVQTILTGDEVIDVAAIEENCRLERLSNTNFNRIGF
ncbi:MAG: ATP-binding protein [Muribaculaceae bacterium]|nr:ATP-binding protein [Muribaculaceae bacterium]